MRVVILKDYVKSNFPCTPLLDYAIEVEKITTSKVRKQLNDNLMNSSSDLMSLSETQLDSQCGWVYWCFHGGHAQKLWLLHSVSGLLLSMAP